MATTIQVREITRQRLELEKRQRGARSFDAVITSLLRERKPRVKSMFGSCKGIGPWTKEHRGDSKHD